jgi:hypothetical protein
MRKAGMVAASLALVLGLTACGSKEAGVPVAGDGTGGSASSGGSQARELDALGLAAAINDNSKAKQSAKIAMRMNAAGQAITMDGQMKRDGADTAMQMTMDMASIKMEMILVDKVLYMKLPAEMTGALGASSTKPWFKVSSTGTDPLSKQMGPMLEQLDDSKQAKETLDGEQTTHYWITLDMAKMAKSSDPNMKQAGEAAAAAGMKSMDMEMWLNADNLPVKVVTKAPAAGQTVEVVATYTDWGKPVDIKAPPADQVGELGPK